MRRKGDNPVPEHELVEKLGEGQFGEVWKARGPGGVLKALKFIPAGKLRREFKAIRYITRVRSPQLISVTDLWLYDSSMRLVDREVFDSLETEYNRSARDTTIATSSIDPALLVIGMELAEKSLEDVLESYKEKGLPANRHREARLQFGRDI